MRDNSSMTKQHGRLHANGVASKRRVTTPTSVSQTKPGRTTGRKDNLFTGNIHNFLSSNWCDLNSEGSYASVVKKLKSLRTNCEMTHENDANAWTWVQRNWKHCKQIMKWHMKMAWANKKNAMLIETLWWKTLLARNGFAVVSMLGYTFWVSLLLL